MRIVSARLHNARANQSGINMVDLMMWLVIAALLLAAAIQSIGYYQRAAIVYQMENDVTQAANTTAASASTNGGFSREVVAQAISDTKSSSKKITLIAAVTPWSPDEIMITAKHPDINEHYVVYLFKEHAPYKVGVNLITKAALDATVGSGGVSIDAGAPIFARKAITLKFNPSYCIEKRASDGQVITKPCDGTDQQDWTWSGDGAFSSGAAKTTCIQPASNGILKTAACNNTADQKFEYRKASNWNVEIFFPKTGQCVERTDGVLANYGMDISLGACVDKDWQRWGLNVKPKMSSDFITAQGPSNPGATSSTACLDNYGGSLMNGNGQGIWGCNQNAAQLWSWSGNGQIYLGTGESKCLDVTGDRVQIWDCNSNPTQTFVSRNVSGKQLAIYSPIANKCIGYTSGNTTSEMILTFTTCNSTINQQWFYDPK